MKDIQTINDQGLECCALENEMLRVVVTRSVGPRVVSFGFRDGENIFAELPGVAIAMPGLEEFHFYGGHRLWHAPEEPGRTYLPDDRPVEIQPLESGLLAIQSVEPQTSLQKAMEIRLVAESAQLVVAHHLTNQGLWDVTCAPWAITQLKPGGVAILPHWRYDTGVLPNRSLALWPYTDMSNPNVEWGRDYIVIRAEMDTPFKVGFPNPRGWLAYWWNGALFVKSAPYEPQARYFDFGSSSECYINDQFVELETLAPITTIAPGATASHIETWTLFRDVARPDHASDVQALVDRLGLG